MYHHPMYRNCVRKSVCIANIQFRFGHISFHQYVQAIITNNIFNLISLASVNIILYISFIYFITLKIIKTKNFNFNFIAVILLTSFLLIKFARYREYGNDIIPLIVSIYFLIQILELKKKQDLFPK